MLGQNAGSRGGSAEGPTPKLRVGGGGSERDREKASLCQGAGSVELTWVAAEDQDRQQRMEKRREKKRLDEEDAPINEHTQSEEDTALRWKSLTIPMIKTGITPSQR